MDLHYPVSRPQGFFRVCRLKKKKKMDSIIRAERGIMALFRATVYTNKFSSGIHLTIR